MEEALALLKKSGFKIKNKVIYKTKTPDHKEAKLIVYLVRNFEYDYQEKE